MRACSASRYADHHRAMVLGLAYRVPLWSVDTSLFSPVDGQREYRRIHVNGTAGLVSTLSLECKIHREFIAVCSPCRGRFHDKEVKLARTIEELGRLRVRYAELGMHRNRQVH
jgi:hypothetical protein